MAKISIKLNGLWQAHEEGLSLGDLMAIRKDEPDICLHNGFTALPETLLCDGDEVVLITKGTIPEASEMEALMAGRHTPGVHDKLKASKVLIAGLGGLGSNIAMALARIGVGHLRLIDYDVVEPSNLNRQAYRISDLGQKKCHALASQLAQINPYLTYEPINRKLAPDNLAEALADMDLVIEAFDTPSAKAMLVTYVLSQTDLKIVSASGMAGLYDPNLITTKKPLNRLYLCGDDTNEAGPMEGLMAPRVLIAAGHQATTACRILLGLA